MKLYEIPLAFADLEQLLADAAGEMTPEIEAHWESIELEGAAKVEAAACVLASLKADQEGLKAEYDRLYARAASLENAQKRLKEMMLPAVQALGGKVKTAKFTVFSTTRATSRPVMKEGTDIWELPPQFVRNKPELNSTAITEAYKAGENLPDCIEIRESSTTFITVR